MRWQVERQETRKCEKTQLLTEKKRLEDILFQRQQELAGTIIKEADQFNSSPRDARLTREDLIRQEHDLQVTLCLFRIERNDDSWQSVLQRQGNQLDVLCREEDLIQSQLEELEGIVRCIRSMDSALFEGSYALRTQQDVEMTEKRCDVSHSFRELNTLKDQLSVLHLEMQAVEPDKQQRARMASAVLDVYQVLMIPACL